ncbi:divalent-cation tolerance protein CutA [Desulfovibrio aminophilus]|nr:divalent-cation tolerance protein CutA [Desulfovibrio aminophilus]MCM0756219.1 divalent-cation tolerance protein CutA [Desulfovibrio aminophilus]
MAEIFVYVTCESLEQAETIGAALVERRLCACVNILPGMRSLYWWKGRLERAEEAVLVAKTRESLLEALTAGIKSLHSYEVPCVVALPILGGNPDFLRWIADETPPSAG